MNARQSIALALIAAGILVGASRPTLAQDSTVAARDLATSSDFRLRVMAALQIGRSKPPGAREALEQALGDSHPAVRVAVADALGMLGDPAAVPALEQRLGADPSPSVKAQIRTTIDKLRSVAQAQANAGPRRLGADVRCVVIFGAMRNASGVRGDELRQVLSDAARSRVQALRGVILSEADGPLLQQAMAKRIPVLVLDGSVSTLMEHRADGNLEIRARVEFTVRHDQTLRGTVSGSATTFGSGPSISDAGRRRLQDEAVGGAVQSALRGAEEGLIVAAR
jgi:hypothetical protein